jgi:hypothetical protein
MTDTTTDLPPTLSIQTQASVQGLVRAKNEVTAWTKNLEQALTDDVTAAPPRLTAEEAAQIARANDVKAPKAPAAPAPAKAPTAAKPPEDAASDPKPRGRPG